MSAPNAFAADYRPIEDADVMGATRGLDMARLPAVMLAELIKLHHKTDMFASAVIVVAAAHRLLLTGAFDFDDYTVDELAAMRRTPSPTYRSMIDEALSLRDPS